MDFKNKKLSIGQAAGLCGVSVKQIRHWEERQYIPKATRIQCGLRSYRYFSESDIEIVRKIKKYLDIGYTLQAAAKKAQDDMARKEGRNNAQKTIENKTEDMPLS